MGEGDEVLITEMEHHSNIVPWQLLCEATGARLRYLTVSDAAELSLDELDAVLGEGRVKLVAFAHVSNVLGTINPVAEIVRRARAAGAVSLVDGSQAVPQMPVDLRAIDADFYAWTGHKALGPTIGLLHGRRELLEEMPPFLGGGHMISRVERDRSTWNELPYKFEAGTSAATEAVGLGAAVDYLSDVGMSEVRAHERDLTEYALERLSGRGGPHPVRPRRPRPPRRRGGFRNGGHPPPRHRRAVRPGGRVRARRTPLRPAADARPGRGRHRSRLIPGLQRARRGGPPGRSPRRGPRGVRALMDALYRDYILEHYKNPKNFGKLDPHDLEWHDHNPLCGDELGVHIVVEDGKVGELRFHGQGCAISQAAASITSEELMGMSLDEVEKLDAEWVIDQLGIDISPTRRKCALLALKVMRGATTGDASWPR